VVILFNLRYLRAYISNKLFTFGTQNNDNPNIPMFTLPCRQNFAMSPFVNTLALEGQPSNRTKKYLPFKGNHQIVQKNACPSRATIKSCEKTLALQGQP
jgi:hypothetical protein